MAVDWHSCPGLGPVKIIISNHNTNETEKGREEGRSKEGGGQQSAIQKG
jgi:hypothetical protein